MHAPTYALVSRLVAYRTPRRISLWMPLHMHRDISGHSRRAPATVSVDFEREATLLWGPRSTGPDNDDIARGRGPRTPTPAVFCTPCGINDFVHWDRRQKLRAWACRTGPGFRCDTLSDVVFDIVRKASARPMWSGIGIRLFSYMHFKMHAISK